MTACMYSAKTLIYVRECRGVVKLFHLSLLCRAFKLSLQQ